MIHLLTDDNIYLDPETRKNSVTYRNNMERLATALIKENKFDKAEEILDISLEKMPVAKFGHYSMLIAYVDLYYTLNKKEKARKLASELKTVFQENLSYYAEYDETNVESIFSDIERSLLMYDQMWLGLMYRYNESMGVNAVYTLKNALSIGYVYDFPINGLRTYQTGSHEIFLRYDFKPKKSVFTSPRYF